MSISESAITLNFPDNNFFRFEECQGYKDLQNNFSEMDACWYDQANDILYLIELKDWSNPLSEETNPNYTAQQILDLKKNITKHRIQNLWKKSIDSVSVFLSILLQKPQAASFQACSPFSISNTTQIQLLSIINWTNPDTTYISSINTEYKAKFRTYAKLYGIKTYLVLTKNQASANFNWVL